MYKTSHPVVSTPPIVFVLLYPRFNAVLFLLRFLNHIVCICHFLDIRPSSSTSTLLSSGPFVWVPPQSILRIVPIILQGGMTSCLFIWGDSWRKAWCRCFLVRLRYIFLDFSYISACLMFSSSCKFPFLRVFWFFFDLAVLFVALFVLFIINMTHF